MTYGWALVLIVTVAAVLFFVFSPGSSSQAYFSSSTPTKIVVRTGTIEGGTAKIQLQNATGGKINISEVSGGCMIAEGTIPLDVGGGGIISLECPASVGQMDSVLITYTDFAGAQRSASITASGRGTTDAALVAYYKLDEVVGGKTPDASGNGHDGTVTFKNPVPQTTGCVNGGCMNFVVTAPPDYIDCGTGIINTTGAYTKLAWIKRANTATYNNIISSNGPVGEYRHVFWVSTNMGFKLMAGNRDYDTVQDTALLAPDSWYQVAVTFDPDVSSGTMKLYKNGAMLPGAGTATGVPNPLSSTTFIGRFADGPTPTYYSFNGLMDEVRVYSRALTASEICSNCKQYAAAAGVTCGC